MSTRCLGASAEQTQQWLGDATFVLLFLVVEVRSPWLMIPVLGVFYLVKREMPCDLVP